MKEISIEGLSPDEILQLTDEEMDQLVLIGQPLVFRAGSSEILGEFKLRDRSLVIELAQINGGGEGVLPLQHNVMLEFIKPDGQCRTASLKDSIAATVRRCSICLFFKACRKCANKQNCGLKSTTKNDPTSLWAI